MAGITNAVRLLAQAGIPCKKVHFDELYDEIAVSAGERGHQMIVSPQALISYLHAGCADITK